MAILALDTQLKDQLQQTVLIATSTAVNNSGERTYGAAVSHKARVVNRTQLRRYLDHDELVKHKVIILGSTVTVTVNDRLWLPGESTSADRGWVINSVETPVDEAGNAYYTRVNLGNLGG